MSSPLLFPLWKMWISGLQEARRWRHTVIFPWAHSDSFTHQPVYCRVTPEDLHHNRKCPFVPIILWCQIPFGEDLPMSTAPSHDVQKASSLPSPSAISSTVAEMRTRGFPMSRRDADHSRLSPLPRPTENNHRRLDWPVIQQVEKSGRKVAWGDNLAKASLYKDCSDEQLCG